MDCPSCGGSGDDDRNMFDKIYLRFKHDWPGFWVRLSVSAALCDGPITEKELQALHRFCSNICAMSGVDEPMRLWKAFSNSPENPESIKNRVPRQHERVLLMFLRELFPMMAADGTVNEKELGWLNAMLPEPAAVAGSVPAGGFVTKLW